MQYIGCLLMALAGAGMGLWGSRHLHRRAAYLHQTVRLLQVLERQLPYTAQPMAVLWRQLAVSGVYEDCRLLRDTLAGLDADVPFTTAFAAALEQARGEDLLSAAGYRLLSECGAGCGRYDLTRQTEHLHHYRLAAEEMADALSAEAVTKGRLYRVMGVAGGVAVSLLLI